MLKKSFYKKKINPDEYVNVTTGELLSSEYQVTSVNVQSDLVILSSTEYIIIDSKARQYIDAEFTVAEKGRIYQMADMVHGCFNLIYDKKENIPHTVNTLSKDIDYGRTQMTEFLKKLHKKSVIYYIDGYKNKKRCKWIMLNPTFARKQKSFDRRCLDVFKDLSK